MADDFEYVSKTRLRYENGARHAYLGDVPEPVVYGVQGVLRHLDHGSEFPDFLADMSGWLQEGRVKYHEDITDGLENAPRELVGLLKGENFGKKTGPALTKLLPQ